MKRVLLSVAALFLAVNLIAQQDAQFSQNMFLTAPINPGVSGIKGMHCIDLVARQQWVGFTGAPKTGLLSYNGPVKPYSNFGWGGVLVYDDVGLQQDYSFKLNGAYHINVGSDGGKLGIGLDLGIMQKGFKNDILNAVDMTDPALANLSGSSDLGLDLGFGLFYYKPERLYFGISGQKLLPQKLTYGMAKPAIRQHAYITTGYYHDVYDNEKVVLKPNMLVKTDLTSTQIDVNLTAEFNKRIWLGGSYRVQDAIVANVGFKTKPTNNMGPIKIGFAYDFTTQGLANQGTFTTYDSEGAVAEEKADNRSLGSVELYMGFCIIPPPPAGIDIYVDPLFL